MEAKLAGFATMSFTEMRVGMRDSDGMTRWIVINKTGTSLQSLFSQTAFQMVTVGRTEWVKLLMSPSLQTGCEREGINVTQSNVKVRLGLVADEDANCGSPSSFIGIGALYTATNCGVDTTKSTTTGNRAPPMSSDLCGSDKGERATQTIGYIMVR